MDSTLMLSENKIKRQTEKIQQAAAAAAAKKVKIK